MMLDLCGLIFGTLRDLLRSRSTLEAEVLVLRQQIIVLRRAGRARLTFSAMDRFVLGWLCALFPGARSALSIVQPGWCCDGIAQGFEPIGAGSRDDGLAVQLSRLKCDS